MDKLSKHLYIRFLTIAVPGGLKLQTLQPVLLHLA